MASQFYIKNIKASIKIKLYIFVGLNVKYQKRLIFNNNDYNNNKNREDDIIIINNKSFKHSRTFQF